MSSRVKDRPHRRSEAVRQALLNPSRRQLSKFQREKRALLYVRLAAIGVGVLVVGLLVAGYLAEAVFRAQETVAQVSDERITAGQLADAARPQYQAISRQVEQLRQSGLGQQAALMQVQLQSLPLQVLSQEVDRRLIAREAQRRSLGVSESEVLQELRERMEIEATLSQALSQATPADSSAPTPSPDVDSAYRAFLQRTGLDDAFYRQELRAQLLRSKVRDAVAQVPSSAEQVHARHILVEAEGKARELLDRLGQGASFEELARAESNDPGSKDRGGDLGWFPRGIMNDAFESAAFNAEVGSGPQVVRSPNGWHILEVLEKQPDRPLESQHLESLKDRAFQRWLQEARQAAGVRIELSKSTTDWIIKRLQGRLL